MRRTGLLTGLMLILLYGCEKKTNSLPVSEELKTHFNYKPGTYWIYTDSLTGETDSCAVTTNVYNEGSLTIGGKTYDQHSIRINVYSNGSYNAYYTLSLYGSSIAFLYNGRNIITYQELFSYPFAVTNQADDDDKKMILNTFPSYTLKGNTYNSVSEIYHTNDQDYHDVYFVSTDAGIIKMTLDHNIEKRIWELERFKIVQ